VTRPQTSSKRNDRAHSNSVIAGALEGYNHHFLCALDDRRSRTSPHSEGVLRLEAK